MTLVQLAFVLLTVTSTSVTTNANHELHWKSHYGTAKRSAQAAKRPLVVVIENSAQTSDKIDVKSLDGESREKLATEDFELVRVDAKTEYGKRVARAFGVQDFPYTAVTDDVSERIVFRKSGPMSQSDWTVALAKSAETKKLVSEWVVVQNPAVMSEVQPVMIPSQQPAPTYQPHAIVIQPNTCAEPQFQPLVAPQMFAPNGLYQMPAAQCLT